MLLLVHLKVSFWEIVNPFCERKIDNQKQESVWQSFLSVRHQDLTITQ